MVADAAQVSLPGIEKPTIVITQTQQLLVLLLTMLVFQLEVEVVFVSSGHHRGATTPLDAAL